MGVLVKGEWRVEHRWSDEDGAFRRGDSQFRDWVTADGSSGYPAEAGRYHLYVSLACPWAHRTLIYRALKGLEDAISISIVDPLMGDEGWRFGDGPGCIPDPVNGARFLREIYTRARPDYSGRVTVPVLWDKKTATIVNNESAEIIRMFNDAFDGLAANHVDFYPPDLRARIDDLNAVVYDRVNNGVYKAGFATRQTPYERAVTALFATLDDLDARLADRRYLCGPRPTEADWRLFTTLIRFDTVYVGHFKCNLMRIADYPNLWPYLRDLYQVPGVAGTVDQNHIKHHYYASHGAINPTRIVPLGPIIDFAAAHDRARLSD